MPSRLLLSLGLLLGASCASPAASRTDGAAGPDRRTQFALAAGAAEPSPEPGEGVPAEFKEVDFANFSYPTGWRKQKVRLENGEHEEYEGESSAGSVWFRLKDVSYSDLTGDGREEAVVLVGQVFCGGSCDGGSHLIYVYSMRRGRPALIWRVETGSLAYGCGLKSLAADGRRITLEAFGVCRPDGPRLVNEPARAGEGLQYKFRAKQFTRLLFEFDGRTFAPKGREVFANPREDVLNFSPGISVGHE